MPALPAWMADPEPPAATPVVDMRVVRREQAADGVLAVDLTPLIGVAPEWAPGAHIDLHLPGGLIRQYSLCGDPADERLLRVAVLREENGRGGSRYIHDELAVGDVVPISEPRNNFELQSSDRYIFIAGGIGVTPLLPMIAQAESAGADWTLAYGGRARRSMAFRADLEGDPRVTIVPEDTHGLLDLARILGGARNDALVYCCGPEPLLAAVEEAMRPWPAGALHVERFKPRETGDAAPDEAIEVTLERSGITLTVEPGVSILETVSRAGVPVPSSCQEGTCGTCETIVLDGVPDHRDSVLTPLDREAGDCMMICVSRSLGGRLVLDL